MRHTLTADRRLFLKGTTAAALTPFLTSTVRAQSEGDAESFYIQPYLQNPTADGMTICFAAIGASDVQVRWGSDPSALNHIAAMKSQPLPKITWLVWKARLGNLSPQATYHYQVTYREGGAQKVSEVYRFTPFDPKADQVRAVVYNDVHDRIPTVDALVKWVHPEDFTFSILLGDMWGDPTLEQNARRAFLSLQAYVRLFDGSNKPMMLVRGNHEVRGSFASHLSHLFDFPLNDPTAEFAAQNAYYDFRVGPVWFLAPDSGEDESKRMETFQPYRIRQAKWLADLLKSSPNRNAPWRVVTTHIPLYHQGQWDAHHSRALWGPVLADGRIDVCISGHIHAHALIPKDKEVVYVWDNDKSEKTTIRYTPPFPTFVGGGPALEEATVTFLSADARHLDLRALNVQGQEVLKLNLEK